MFQYFQQTSVESVKNRKSQKETAAKRQGFTKDTEPFGELYWDRSG